MPTAEEYQGMITRLRWPGLQRLWEAIKKRDTPGWDRDIAFQYLILRAFELDGGRIKWPYTVRLFGADVEQIDGSVSVGALYCLVESKDESESIAIGPIAKLRNQILRRPSGTIGLFFASGKFTDPAIQLVHFTLPQAILLWSGDEVDYCVARKKIGDYCERKYRACVDYGIPDFDVSRGTSP